jgi:hypothetical protein
MREARRRAALIKADPIAGKDTRRLTGRDLDEFYARLASAGGRSGKGMHSTTRHHFADPGRALPGDPVVAAFAPTPAGEAQAAPLAPDERLRPTLTEPDALLSLSAPRTRIWAP